MKENQNELFPIFLKLEQFNVLIIGGGKVALEKLLALKNNSPATRIKIVGTVIDPSVKEFTAKNAGITAEERAYSKEDILNADIVIAAVNNIETAKKI
jgi:uncharacterized protein